MLDYKPVLTIENMLDRMIGFFLFQYKKKDNLFSWYYDCLVYQHVTLKNITPKYNYYEFGVAGGGSIEVYILALKKFCKIHKANISDFHIYGFDSFKGLPEKMDCADNHIDWKQGKMIHEENEVEKKVAKLNFPKGNLHLIKGFYQDSLTDELSRQLTNHKPCIVNIDCDYYSSTITALKWLQPLLTSGCIFRFDDVWAFHGNPNCGQLKAINEFNKWDAGIITPFPLFGLISYSYIFSKKNFEFVEPPACSESDL